MKPRSPTLMDHFPKTGIRVTIPPSNGELKKHAEAGLPGDPPTKHGVIVGWTEKEGGTIIAKIQLDSRKAVSTFQSKRKILPQEG